MAIHAIQNTCSHLQNAAKARLGLTSIPNHKYNLAFALALHRAGFISSVTRAGPHPPTPEEIQSGVPEPVTHANVATRRLWLGLKYWNDKPVMSTLQSVSKPKRYITADLRELGRIARGFSIQNVKGLTLGECMFLGTDRGVLEIREALDKRVGGLLLARVS